MFYRNESKYTFEEIVFHGNGAINEQYKPVTKGIYHSHFKRWLEYFPRNQILLLNGDDYVKDPYPILKKVELFLGLRSYIKRSNVVWNDKKKFYCPKPHDRVLCLGAGKGVHHPHISEEILNKVRDFYRPHNKLFEEITGQKFDWS